MIGLLSILHLNRPYFFVLLLLLPIVWFRLRERSMGVILWRSLILLLLVLALTDLQVIRTATKTGERIFAFDLSRSIPDGMRDWMARQSRAAQPGDRTYVFAGEVQEVADWERWLRGEAPSRAVRPEQTNLENIFAALLRLPAAPRSVFLLTDGWENQGTVERLIPSLSRSGIKVFPLLPPERPRAANVVVKKVLTPHQGMRGEGINLKIAVENQGVREVDGELILKRNGQLLKSEAVRIKPGSRIFTYEAALSEESMVSFQAQFVPRQPELDLFAQDSQATTWVAVRSKEKALLLNGRAGEGRYLEELLKRRGYDVTSLVAGESPTSPQGYGLVIFNNVERERFPSGYLAAVERHVAAGNGFLMLGGEGSFAPGGYRQTPIESLLPVELREPKREEKNRALILVLDKSGSMREENRLLYAKEAAKAVAGQLQEKDLLGVIGFDVEPFVVVPLSPVERIRNTAASQIDRLKAQGKTYLYPAILEAKRQLERQSAGRKHVIILSDGETGGSGGDYKKHD